jgi:hypothetical protein
MKLGQKNKTQTKETNTIQNRYTDVNTKVSKLKYCTQQDKEIIQHKLQQK